MEEIKILVGSKESMAMSRAEKMIGYVHWPDEARTVKEGRELNGPVIMQGPFSPILVCNLVI